MIAFAPGKESGTTGLVDPSKAFGSLFAERLAIPQRLVSGGMHQPINVPEIVSLRPTQIGKVCTRLTQTLNSQYVGYGVWCMQHVAAGGTKILAKLDPKPGEFIVDIGCGTGELTCQIAQSGAAVLGIDASTKQVETAIQYAARVFRASKITESSRVLDWNKWPKNLAFSVGDITKFNIAKIARRSVDAFFANATLHWVQKQPLALKAIHDNLVSGGRLVFESGGNQNVQSRRDAIYAVMAQNKYDIRGKEPWFLPTAQEYEQLLTAAGFSVVTIEEENQQVPSRNLKADVDFYITPLLAVMGVEPGKRAKIINQIAKKIKPVDRKSVV